MPGGAGDGVPDRPRRRRRTSSDRRARASTTWPAPGQPARASGRADAAELRRPGRPDDRRAPDRAAVPCRAADRASRPRSPRRWASAWTRVEAVRARMLRFDPAGLFARDLKECLAAQLGRAQPARSGDGDPAGQPRSAGQARDLRRLMAALRRGCRGPGRHDRPRSARSTPSPAPRCEAAPAAAGGAGRADARRPGRRLAAGAEPRDHAARAGQPAASTPACAPRAAQGGRAFLAERLPSANWLVKSLQQRSQTILKVASRDRAPAGRFPPPRRRASAAADPARHRRRGGDAREHRQPGDRRTSTSPRRAACSS